MYVLRGSAIPVGCAESFEPPPWCQVVAKGKQSRKQMENLAKARAAKRAKARNDEEGVAGGSAAVGVAGEGRADAYDVAATMPDAEGSAGFGRARCDMTPGLDVRMQDASPEGAEVPVHGDVAAAAGDGDSMCRGIASMAGARHAGGANIFGGGSSDEFSEARSSSHGGVAEAGLGDGGGSSDEAGRRGRRSGRRCIWWGIQRRFLGSAVFDRGQRCRMCIWGPFRRRVR